MELAQRWFDRIAARVSIDPNRIFPSDELLDHVEVLLAGIADYIEDPADEISADMPVVAKAIELGELRHSQGFGAQEILKEYELLGGVLFSFLVRHVDEVVEQATRSELLACAHRLFRAISVIEQITTNQYLALADERVHEREERLRSFNRTVTHELKNRIGAVVGAAQILGEDWIREDPAQLDRFVAIVVNNAEAMQAVLQDLLSLSRMDPGALPQRNVLLPEAVAEVLRQLRDLAAERGAAVRVVQLPEVEVNAPVVELCLSNYISNAIKYANPAEGERWVEIHAESRQTADGGLEVVVAVRDNGLGVPEPMRDRLFQRFFRGDEVTSRGIEGTGLGLSIVRETVEAHGGRAWAEFSDETPGSTFLFSLPMGTVLPPPDDGEG